MFGEGGEGNDSGGGDGDGLVTATMAGAKDFALVIETRPPEINKLDLLLMRIWLCATSKIARSSPI